MGISIEYSGSPFSSEMYILRPGAWTPAYPAYAKNAAKRPALYERVLRTVRQKGRFFDECVSPLHYEGTVRSIHSCAINSKAPLHTPTATAS